MCKVFAIVAFTLDDASNRAGGVREGMVTVPNNAPFIVVESSHDDGDGTQSCYLHVCPVHM